MRSVVVVFPASIWAMIPMLRNRCNGACLDIGQIGPIGPIPSPSIVRERLVRVRHAMGIVFLLHRITAVVRCIENLTGETIGHCLLATAARVTDHPPDGQAVTPRLLIDL